MRKKPSDAYIDKAKQLTQEETERLLARMRAKLMRRLEERTLSELEVVAIQLEVEEEELHEWREKMAEISKKTKSK